MARGGLCWSDRREDFRTEILVWSRQQVRTLSLFQSAPRVVSVLKNATDERPRGLPGRVAWPTRPSPVGLLDITDNIVKGAVVPPANVVRQDGDDPTWWLPPTRARPPSPTSPMAYLPNMASGWAMPLPRGIGELQPLKMGITARGAWESVNTHFRALA